MRATGLQRGPGRRYKISLSKRETLVYFTLGLIMLYVAFLVGVGSVSNDLSLTASPLSLLTAPREGWSTIHIHFGQFDGLEPKGSDKKLTLKGVEWFSQVGQDKVMVDLIGENGYFIDLAANDAVEFSNTLALEKSHGWKGLCVEPNPAYWYRLGHRTGCTVVGAMVGGDSPISKEPRAVRFRGVYGGLTDTMDARLANRKKEPPAPTEYRYMVSFETLLEKFSVPSTIDYLSLDVEGAEYLVMEKFPFDRYLIRVLTVERPSANLRDLLQAHGYMFLKDLAWWGETLWAHKSMGLSPEHPKVRSIVTEQK